MRAVETLGPARYPSPLGLSLVYGDKKVNYVPDTERVIRSVVLRELLSAGDHPEALEKAGPREKLFFDPPQTTAGIVTCGGLCPGLNNVIRGLVLVLLQRYGVKRVLGFRYGYEGLVPAWGHDPIELTEEFVDDIDGIGGTVLGTSRGNQDKGVMVSTLQNLGVDILFCIGGDGTLRGAGQIKDEVARRRLPIAVVGVPKTIDNDIYLMDRSFGFETAFSVSSMILRAAHNEAKCHYNGVALVKLMGRESGFIAASAALAIPSVNYVLIPEMEFDLEGPAGFLGVLERRLARKHHALVVVSEGAGQRFFREGSPGKDASGNIRFNDIGIFLKTRIESHFKSRSIPNTVKYIDPSYIIRSGRAVPNDAKFATVLAQYAVHGAMAGKTGLVVGRLHEEYVHIPISEAVSRRKTIDLESQLWLDVLQATGQPQEMTNPV